MSADAQRFAHLVLSAFEAAGRTTDAQVGAAGGPSTSTMTKLRAARGGGPLAEPRSTTWTAIERAANWPPGAARAVWAGGDPPETPDLPASVRQIGDPGDDLVEFQISGNFGVTAVVKGPIRDLDVLQATVSKIIAGMQIDESNTRTMP